MPTSAQSLCLPRRTTGCPGRRRPAPCRARARRPARAAWPPARSARALIAAAVALPSRICRGHVRLHPVAARPRVLTRSTLGAIGQWKKCRVPVKYIVTPGRLGGLDDLLVAHRPARLHDAAHAGVDQDLQPVGEREERVRRGDRARRPARRPASTASRHESTRLTWPMPTPTVAPPAASRIALDFTARQARQANARSASVASSAGVAGRQRPGRRVVAAARRRGRACLHQQPAADRPELDAARRVGRRDAAPGCSSCRCSTSTAPSSYAGATITSVKTSATCSAIATDTGGWPRSRRRRRRPGRTRAPCGAPRRRRRRPRCRTGWRA